MISIKQSLGTTGTHKACVKPFSSGTGPQARRHVRCCAAAASPAGQHTQRPAADTSLARQLLVSAAAAAAVCFSSTTPALAFGPVSVKLEDITVNQIECGAGISTVGGVTFSGSSRKAACLDIQAAATNPSSKPLFNADVFGRIYDVNQEPMLDDTENIRIAYIDEIPPGRSTVSFRINVPLEQFKLGPVSLNGFKASGFPGKVLPKTTGGGGGQLLDEQSLSDCEITGDCSDLEAAAAIR